MEIRHHRFDRITIDPEKCLGKACIKGLRIPVSSILGFLGSGHGIDDVLREWPELDREDVHRALAYAAAAMEERIVPLVEATTG